MWDGQRGRGSFAKTDHEMGVLHAQALKRPNRCPHSCSERHADTNRWFEDKTQRHRAEYLFLCEASHVANSRLHEPPCRPAACDRRCTREHTHARQSRTWSKNTLTGTSAEESVTFSWRSKDQKLRDMSNNTGRGKYTTQAGSSPASAAVWSVYQGHAFHISCHQQTPLLRQMLLNVCKACLQAIEIKFTSLILCSLKSGSKYSWCIYSISYLWSSCTTEEV